MCVVWHVIVNDKLDLHTGPALLYCVSLIKKSSFGLGDPNPLSAVV